MDQWLKPDIIQSDYIDIFEDILSFTIEKGLSFMVKDSRDRFVGVALNFDGTEEPDVNISCINILTINEFTDCLESSVRYYFNIFLNFL